MNAQRIGFLEDCRDQLNTIRTELIVITDVAVLNDHVDCALTSREGSLMLNSLALETAVRTEIVLAGDAVAVLKETVNVALLNDAHPAGQLPWDHVPVFRGISTALTGLPTRLSVAAMSLLHGSDAEALHSLRGIAHSMTNARLAAARSKPEKP